MRTKLSGKSSHPRILLGLCLLMLGVAGCGEDTAVRTYRVSRTVPEVFQQSDRILGAMVENAGAAWFFKMSGPADAIDHVEDSFKDFVRSIHFDDSVPHWQLPEGWQQKPGTAMRFATIIAPAGDTSVEATVTQLPATDPWPQLVTANVNRWRGQIGLEPVEDGLAASESLELAQHESPAVLVDVTGTRGPGSSMSTVPPMMAESAAATAPPPVMNSSPAAASELKYDVPEGWRDGRAGVMRLAAFEAGPVDAIVEITVIRAGGDIEGNIRRWLGQIRADVPDELVAEAIAEAEPVERPGGTGQLFRLTGDSGRSIFAVIFPEEDGSSLFVKMTGDSETAVAEEDALVAFASSLETEKS